MTDTHCRHGRKWYRCCDKEQEEGMAMDRAKPFDGVPGIPDKVLDWAENVQRGEGEEGSMKRILCWLFGHSAGVFNVQVGCNRCGAVFTQVRR